MEYFWILDVVGLIAFSISGFLTGIRKRLDLLGILMITFITASAGGITRDAISGRPPFIFQEYYPVLTILVSILLAFILKLHHVKRIDKVEQRSLFIIMDGIGLVAFSITGALVAIEFHFNFFGIVLLAFLTAVGGGIIRDVMLNDVPVVFVSDFYGTVAVFCALILASANLLFGQAPVWVIVGTFILGLLLRLVAYYRRWQIPKILPLDH